VTDKVKQISWGIVQTTVIRLAAAAIFLLGLRWLYLFVLTDYRAHHQIWMIPIAFLTLGFAVGLWLRKNRFVGVLLIAAAATFTYAVYIQISAGQIHLFLLCVAIIALLCLVTLTPGLKRRFGGK
jgi:hypothetical protein